VTRKRDRAEDLLLEMRASVSPVDSPEAVRARRERTVAHLRGLQARASVLRQVRSTWRTRLFVAAALVLPSLAGASFVRWSGLIGADREMPATTPEDAPKAARPPGSAPGHSPPAGNAEVSPVGTSAPAEPSTPAPGDRAPRVNGAARHGAARVTIPPSATLPEESSSLADENRLMLAAMSAGRAGDDAGAVRLLTELLTRHPTSPLAQNATVERFRALKRLGDQQAASQTARRYLKDYPVGMASDEARRLAAEPKPEAPPRNAAFPR
jgi:hypothetical protein